MELVKGGIGVSERRNRYIMKMMRCMLHEKELPKSFWVEAANTTVFLQNRLPTKALESKAPFEAWNGFKPLRLMKVFGCICFFHVPQVKRDKFDKRVVPEIFVSYSASSKAYKVYDPQTGKMIVSRDVHFNEEETWDWKNNQVSVKASEKQTFDQWQNELVDNPLVRGTRLLYDIYQQSNVEVCEPAGHDKALQDEKWKNVWLVEEFKKEMMQVFEMTNLGLMAYFLGMEIKQGCNEIFICQKKYVREILKKFHMENYKATSTPMNPKEKLIKEDGTDKVNEGNFRSLIGCLMYLTTTRPDILFVVSRLSRFIHYATEMHLQVAKRIIRYIKDSDLAGSTDDMKSISGYCFSLGSEIFSWCFKKQEIVAQSMAEAEFIAATTTVHIVYMGKGQHDDAELTTSTHHQILTSVLGSPEAAKDSIIYSYKHGFSGFAAKLTKSQAKKIAELPDVVHVIPNHLYKLHTTRSWDYLGLSTSSPPTNLLQEANMGDGIIIGVLDSGFPLSLSMIVDVYRGKT
ncbi:putative transcription factor TCP14-like [Capsicum annuum]|nr:putative transcription factor TCP14-like [Capsicum annuum]